MRLPWTANCRRKYRDLRDSASWCPAIRAIWKPTVCSFVENFTPPSSIARCDLVFYVAGALDDALCARIACRCPVEAHFVADTPGRIDRAFQPINRFVRVPGILRAYDLVIVSDIDGVLDLSHPRFGSDIKGAAAGWIVGSHQVPWQRHYAGFVFFTRSRPGFWIARAMEEILRLIYRPKRNNDNWFIDQVSLVALLNYAPSEILSTIHLLKQSDAAHYFKNTKLDPAPDSVRTNKL